MVKAAPAPTGILLVNTGTPDEPTEEAIRSYLAEFLTDPMLFTFPRPLWKCILNLFILPHRPAKTVNWYRRIWTPDGARFMLTSQAQRAALEVELGQTDFADGSFCVELAMRYGNPSIMNGLRALRDAQCATVVVVPLYPQYTRACAGTCIAAVKDALADLGAEGWNPELRVVEHFYEQPAYRAALAESIAAQWDRKPGGMLLFSWHSIPYSDIENGDPYLAQDEETAAAVAAALRLEQNEWTLSFQSRFDTRTWLSPFTADEVERLGKQGVTDLCVVCPGFVADNLETLVEVNEQLRETYLAAAPAGSTFTYVTALNDNPALARSLAGAIRATLAE